ncbi:MAG: adenosine deaminase, partial [Bacteroidota bacterium]
MAKCLFLLLLIPGSVLAQSHETLTAEYLESIRGQDAFLRQFFQQMPKGGDLHHHYSGSVYAETLLETAQQDSMWVNLETGKVAPNNPAQGQLGAWQWVPDLVAAGIWKRVRIQLLMAWSRQYFDPATGPSDEHFFNAFGKFGRAAVASIPEGLLRIKERAKNENVQYIEEMLMGIGIPAVGFDSAQNEEFWRHQEGKQGEDIQELLADTYAQLMEAD